MSEHSLQQQTGIGIWRPDLLYRAPRSAACPAAMSELLIPGHSINGSTFSVLGTITPFADVCLDDGRLPAHTKIHLLKGHNFLLQANMLDLIPSRMTGCLPCVCCCSSAPAA